MTILVKSFLLNGSWHLKIYLELSLQIWSSNIRANYHSSILQNVSLDMEKNINNVHLFVKEYQTKIRFDRKKKQEVYPTETCIISIWNQHCISISFFKKSERFWQYLQIITLFSSNNFSYWLFLHRLQEYTSTAGPNLRAIILLVCSPLQQLHREICHPRFISLLFLLQVIFLQFNSTVNHTTWPHTNWSWSLNASHPSLLAEQDKNTAMDLTDTALSKKLHKRVQHCQAKRWA